jgi:hypothetical protein
MTYQPLANGNLDFSSLLEGISALQRNPQAYRVSGVGAQSFTGSVIYAIIVESGSVLVNDVSSSYNYGCAAPGISVPAGIPVNIVNVTAYGANPGAGITVTPSNLSTVHWAVVYK